METISIVVASEGFHVAKILGFGKWTAFFWQQMLQLPHSLQKSA